MLKCVNLFICLLAFLLSDVTSLQCSDKPGKCPPIAVPCDLPLPFLLQDIPPCNCDVDCKSTYKCCETTCFTNKICLPAISRTIINDNALENNVKESPLNHIDDNIKKIFKLQDSDTPDNELIQLANNQEIEIQGQKKNVEPRKVNVINVFYNIINKYYIQNLNVYNGVDKTVDGGNKINSEETNKTNDTWCGTIDVEVTTQGCFDEDCVNTEESSGSGSGLETQPSNIIIITEPSEYVTKSANPSTNVTIVKRPENPGCHDDEDCNSNKEFNSEGTGSGFSPEGSGFYEGSGDDHLNHDSIFEETVQIELPTKYSTLEGTHHLFFDKEIKVADEEGMKFNVETEIEF